MWGLAKAFAFGNVVNVLAFGQKNKPIYSWWRKKPIILNWLKKFFFNFFGVIFWADFLTYWGRDCAGQYQSKIGA